ncbi:Cell surface protein [Acidisarcina polymorpha]|uniref:Cell surface protein n=1 Tax=Acidisarcina polymorpha TaxID=2211140 RepID=A0A2Z5FUA4_9BACT|nr:chitobiase/beta-hexosaminidase C-terminal domain-containing protein [Acidisarcina polymorpha]AXC10292.1 Cell surface protein [Acidisarcina polymorpha]
MALGPSGTPTYPKPDGTYRPLEKVTISTTLSGAAIYYTTDGSTPTASSTEYTGQITLTASEVVKAIAVSGGVASEVGAANYVVNYAAIATTTTLASSQNPSTLEV